MKSIEDIRERIPALAQSVYGKPLVYLDNAATSQKPVEVIELLNMMNSGINANVHRAMYKLSDEATNLYEGARERVKKFINSPNRSNIIFTSGATAAINLVAGSYCAKYLKAGDSVIVTEDSHHSNIVPWQLACERAGAELKVLHIDENGQWIMSEFEQLIDERVKIVAAAHISNVLGLVYPIKELIEIAHKHNIPVLVDGAQGIVHSSVDVQELNCDFYTFSAHKIYGETGSGILYGKEELLEAMPPYMGGGDMVGTVTFEKTTYAELPLKFEAGTPNFIGQAALRPALDFAQELKLGELGKLVNESEQQIIAYMNRALKEIDGTTIYGTGENKIPLFSFNIDGCHPGDIAQILDKMGIAVRTGLMCAEPLMTRFGVTSMVRASFAPYNTLQEAEYFIQSLKRAVQMLR